MNVLIIEDNPTNMKLAADLLKRQGHTVFQAADAATGIVIAREEIPDLILMDIQLPGMDGLSAVRILREDERTKHIKIYALTAFAMSGDRERMIEGGCDGYIPKPIRYKEFFESVDKVLKEMKS